jgi:hypothetical protein
MTLSPAPRAALSVLLALSVVTGASGLAAAAELKAGTAAAFDHYVRVAEARMDADIKDPGRFIAADARPQAERVAQLDRLRRGEVLMERVRVREAGREIDIPDGMLHHWVGLVFLPGVKASEAVALLQDYDRHATLFAPAVVRSRLRARDGNRFLVYLRFYMKKVIAVTMDTENAAEFTTLSPDRVYSIIRSTRVNQVAEAGTPRERQEPEGQGGGFLWRLNTYWRFLERDGGTYVQCESITLTRDIPFGFGWLIGPFVTSIPRESLLFTMQGVRRALARPR